MVTRRVICFCWAVAAWAPSGCSTVNDPADGSAEADGSRPPGDGGAGDGSASGAVSMTHRLAGIDPQHGLVAKGGRLVSLPEAISASLGAITTATLKGGEAAIETLVVEGRLPSGRIEASVYDPGLDLVVLLVRAQRPHRMEVVTLALGAKATFTTLTQPTPQPPDGSLFSGLYPRGGGQLLTQRGDQLLTLTISGGSATFDAAGKTPAGLTLGKRSGAVVDVAKGRLLRFGKEVFDPPTMKLTTQPVVQQLPLAPPYAFGDVTLGGDVPMAVSGLSGIRPWTVFDAKGNRLLVAASYNSTCGAMPCIATGLWIADLGLGRWTKTLPFFNPPSTSSDPFAVDDAGQRVLAVTGGRLQALPFDPMTTWVAQPLTQKGDLGPLNVASGVLLADGRIVSTDGDSFRVLDTQAAVPRWELFGTAHLPSTIGLGHAAAADASGRILFFGGTSTSGAPPSDGSVYVLAADGKTLDKRAIGSGPPPRSGHGALVVDGSLYIAGGSAASPGGTGGLLDDVWALDLQAGSWRKVGALPEGITSISLRLGAAGELLVLGSVPPAAPGGDWKPSQVAAITLANGQSRILPAQGAAPTLLWSKAPLGSGFVGFESGNTIDASQPNLWSCRRDGDSVVWTTTALDADDYALDGLRGVGAVDGQQAWFIGRQVWQAVRP